MRNKIISLWVLVVLMSSFVDVGAQSLKQQRQKKAKLEKEIAMIDQQLAENSTKSDAMLSTLDLLNKNIENRNNLIKETNSQIRMLSDSMAVKQRTIDALQRRVDTLTNHYSKLVLSAYKNRDTKVWFLYIFSSQSISQGYRRYSYFKNLSNQMNEEAKKIKETQQQLNKEKDVLSDLKKEAVQLKKSQEKERNALKTEQEKVDQIIQQLEQDKEKYQKELEEKKRQVEALNKEIERLVQEAMKKASAGKKKKIDYTLSNEFSRNKGKLPWPAEGPVVGRFGRQTHPVFKNLELPHNKGIDIAVKKRADVKSVFNGQVVQVVVLPQYNHCVMIQHGEYLSVYCKLKVVHVSVGDTVKTGEVVGEVDTINGETELHFEIWKGNQPMNPSVWLR